MKREFKNFGITALRIVCAEFLCILAVFLFAQTEVQAGALSDGDFLKARDKVLRNERGLGSEIILRGVNAGGWLIQEPWMCPVDESIGDQKTIDGTLESRFGKERAKALLDVYYDSFWTEEDFDRCERMGMNLIRLPFWYRNIVDESGNFRQDAFERLDWFVEQAGQRGIYVILDMHGAPGSQNGRDTSGDISSGRGLWTGADVMYNQTLFVEIWERIAGHYKGNPVIAGYDLLNESYSKDTDTTNEQVWTLYAEAYDAVRAVDTDHIIIMEATWEPFNLPNPTKYGWENVMYEYHAYNYDNQLDPEQQLGQIKNKLFLIRLTNYNVPSYIGETSFFSNMESWPLCLDALNESGLSWSLWNYKVMGDGTNSWGIYNMNIERADISNDSYETIKRKWSATVTDDNYINAAVADQVSQHFPYETSGISIREATVEKIPDQIYTGSEITPDVTVKYQGRTLEKNTDYTLSYVSNRECGAALAVVTGAGHYNGILEVPFKILPDAVANFTAAHRTRNSVTLSWSVNDNAAGYYLYRNIGGSYVLLADLNSYATEYTVSNLDAGKSYRFRICAYTVIDQEKCAGVLRELDISTLTESAGSADAGEAGKNTGTVQKNKIKSVKLKAKVSGRKIKLTWKKVPGAKGYEIYVSRKKKGGYRRVKRVKSPSVKKYVYKVKKGKRRYFVKVRAYARSGGKKVYGKFSKIRKLRAG